MLPITIDTETYPIADRPAYPPPPVGVSIIVPGKAAKYWAWGHVAGGNNCTRADAERALRSAYEDAYRERRPLLFQNAKFDLEVIEKEFGLRVPVWHMVHDTMFLLALNNPFMRNFALKPAAEELLGLPPEEQNALHEWILRHVYTTEKSAGGTVHISPDGVKPPGMFKVPPSKAGAFTAYAPGDLAARYANGDTKRTLELFKLLYPRIKAEMQVPYDRDRRLLPILLRNEQEGIRVNTRAIKQDLPKCKTAIDTVDSYLRRRLKAKTLNVDSDAELADALDSAGVVTEWVYTEKSGQRSTSKKYLTKDKFSDEKIFLALGYRNRMKTVTGTFLEPWLGKAAGGDGHIHCHWNQLRQSRTENDPAGTRTGRPSSSNPNFLNIPKTFEGRGDGYTHPKFLKGLPELPLARTYLLPDPGCEWIHRDYSQQELRILAHFEDGDLLQSYREDPTMDVHNFVQDLIAELVGETFPRKFIKETNFGKIYGMGLAALSAKIGTDDVGLVREVSAAHRRALPGVTELEQELRSMGADERIRTWGGRLVPLEPPKMVQGRWRSFEYKRLNYLIQGSAADCTKEAIIRYDSARKHGRFLVTVYDENNICAPRGKWREEDAILRECMEGIEFDVPMLTDMKHGSNWGSIR